MVDFLLAAALLALVIVGVAVTLILLYIIGRALSYGLKEWHRAIRQGHEVYLVISTTPSYEKGVVRWIRAVFKFAREDFGARYATIDITDPISGEVKAIKYNGSNPT